MARVIVCSTARFMIAAQNISACPRRWRVGCDGYEKQAAASPRLRIADDTRQSGSGASLFIAASVAAGELYAPPKISSNGDGIM